MYTGTLRRAPFRPDESQMYHHEKREEYAKKLRLEREGVKCQAPLLPSEKKEAGSLAELLNLISPEDSALISLILFLLCDTTWSSLESFITFCFQSHNHRPCRWLAQPP